ncbi:recombinase family protein [Streptomyces chryseus]
MSTPLQLPATFQGSPSSLDGEPWLGYIRISTWKEEQISTELQMAAIEAWAKRTKRRIVAWIEDLDMTGRNFNRKVMKGITSVERGEVRGIVVWKYSRFGRSRDGVAINLKRVEDAGGQLESATEEADARTATGRLQRGILFEIAAYESDRAGEQWKETHNHRRYKLRLPATGRPRFGYDWHPRRLPNGNGGWLLQEERYEVNLHQGPVLAEVYRQYIGGSKFYAQVASLNERGYRTVRGGLWTEQTLIRYMDSGFPAGLLRLHNPGCRCKPEKRGNCQNTVFVDGAHEELVSAELWQQYQEHRAEMRATPPRARTPLYPLTNLVKHGPCRGTTPAHSASRKLDGEDINILGYSYQCGRRASTGTHGCSALWVTREQVENDVHQWIRNEVAGGVDAAPSVPKPRPTVDDSRALAARERVRLQAEADKLATALVNLRTQRAMDPDDFEPGEYEAARDRIRQQQKTTQAALERSASVETSPHRVDYEPLMLDLLEAWPHLKAQEKNRLLKQVLRRVSLDSNGDGGAVTITMHPVWEPDPWADKAPAAISQG